MSIDLGPIPKLGGELASAAVGPALPSASPASPGVSVAASAPANLGKNQAPSSACSRYFKSFAYNIISFPVKSAWWSAQTVWSITPEVVKAPIERAGSLAKKAAKVALCVSAGSLIYQASKAKEGAPTVANEGSSSGSAIMTHVVNPVIGFVAPVASDLIGNATDVVKEAVIETATDALTGAGPLLYKGCEVALTYGWETVSYSASLASGMITGTWHVVRDLDNTTKAYYVGALGVGLVAKYYAGPRIRKFFKPVPLPRWIWRGDAHCVTPLSRMIQSLKKRIWKRNELEPVLNEDIRKRVERIIEANNNILKNGGIFRNILLLGEPGTGKTMLVEKIARDSGFNFIKISGADFSPHIASGNGVSALNEVLAFIRNSIYPTVFVIDEIEAICPSPHAIRNREPTRAEKEFRSALLAAIGKSQKLLIVGTTNDESSIDAGLLSRLNNRIQMDIPDRDSRVKILTQTIDMLLGKIPERETCLSKENIEKLADRTDGMSGRSLFQLVDSLVMQRPASSEERLTEEIIEEVLGFYLEDLKRDREAKEARWTARFGRVPETEPPKEPPKIKEESKTEDSSKVELLIKRVTSLEEELSSYRDHLKRDREAKEAGDRKEEHASQSSPLTQPTIVAPLAPTSPSSAAPVVGADAKKSNSARARIIERYGRDKNLFITLVTKKDPNTKKKIYLREIDSKQIKYSDEQDGPVITLNRSEIKSFILEKVDNIPR